MLACVVLYDECTVSTASSVHRRPFHRDEDYHSRKKSVDVLLQLFVRLSLSLLLIYFSFICSFRFLFITVLSFSLALVHYQLHQHKITSTLAMICDRSRLAYVTAVAVGTGTAVFFLWWWWTKRQKQRPPSKWRKVGELSDLIAFPIKSLGSIRHTAMECTQLGLKSGWMRDRTLMVIDHNGHFITARRYPKMVQVTPSFEGSVLTLQASGMMSVSIDLAALRGDGFRAAIWGQIVPACDCGEEAARWLSRFLLQEDTGLRLVFYPLERPSREILSALKIFSLYEKNDSGAFPDVTSYMLMNEASLTDLNTRLEQQVVAQQFRPNFVVKGATAYEEDTWDWIKIGDLIFRNVKPCTRCIFTTIDPESGEKNSKMEPLKTLKLYRQINDPVYRPYTGDSPVMGIHLGLKGPNGTVRLGDPVYVGVPEEKEKPVLASP